MVECARSACRRRLPGFLASLGRIGTYLDHQWYCSDACVEAAVRQRIEALPPVEPAYVQAWRPLKLGSLITYQTGLPREVVEGAIARHGTDAPVGKTLREAGLVTSEDVLRALATQAGVRYLTSVNPRVVAHRPGELPRDVVRALGIVPIAADPEKKELQVACTAPIPGLAVRAMTRLTNWSVEPLLVTDETLPHLIEVYAAARHHRSTAVGDVCDPASGPARIAELARRRRVVRMIHERCDPYVWVRLDSDGSTADVLMTLSEMEGSY